MRVCQCRLYDRFQKPDLAFELALSHNLVCFCLLLHYRIAGWDVLSQILNYTGASFAGPTIFAIIYSSVTIWTAVFSQLILGRTMNFKQWLCVILVFSGLGITATNSVTTGKSVLTGSLLVIVGSAMHGLTYVLSEGIMTVGQEKLSVIQNNFVQSSFNGGLLLVWQFLYTIPHFNDAVWSPMQDKDTSVLYASILLGGFGSLSIIHSLTHFHTLKHYPGGATSAGVMKGLQAVLVFVFTNILYCNKLGGPEMCFSDAKFVALVTVCGGVLGYVHTTQTQFSTNLAEKEEESSDDETTSLVSRSP